VPDCNDARGFFVRAGNERRTAFHDGEDGRWLAPMPQGKEPKWPGDGKPGFRAQDSQEKRKFRRASFLHRTTPPVTASRASAVTKFLDESILGRIFLGKV